MSYSTQNDPQLDLNSLFPFPLDDFQYNAIQALNGGKSVVVCAPTGSGKTLVGEYAIHRALQGGRRVFYTTPLKALSNQKFRDFREQFGWEKVGLLTGDISVNRDAPVVVMTTEIFRNMLYGTPIGEVGTSLEAVEAVVLDECHYMNDRQRGTVWEESIIYCPREIQLVALSATVANSEQLTHWISQVHGPTELIYSDFRPVPLQYHFCNVKGFFPLLDDALKRINPRLKEKKGIPQRGRRNDVPNLAAVLSHLQERDMLPAIYFIFSRKGCDRSVAEVRHLSLVNEAETALLKKRIDAFLASSPEGVRAEQVEVLYRGIAAHHAGLLPTWKGLVEELFQQGLIKVVFATETLAAGINMPARTTVISSLSKRTDDGHRLLKPSEFLQMSGRAGRRGMDIEGYVVTVQTPFEGSKEAAYLATSKPDPLVSQFTPSYGMVLNLLQRHSLEQAKELIERSFGQYLSTINLIPAQREIEIMQAELALIEAQFGFRGEQNMAMLEETLASFEKIYERLREERRLLKLLQNQAEDSRIRRMAVSMELIELGTIVGLRGKHVPTARSFDAEPIPSVLVAKTPSSGQVPYFLCLGRDNRWYVVSSADIVILQTESKRLNVDYLDIPNIPFKLGQCRKGDQLTVAMAQQIPDLSLSESSPEIIAQQQQVERLKLELDAHPIHDWGKPNKLLKRWQRWAELDEIIQERRTELEDDLAHHWQEFLALISILQYFEALDELKPTDLGQATAALRGDNELWLGLVLKSGIFDDLDPHHLAAACAALVTEVSRPDSWTRYELSENVENALGRLRGVRQELFKQQRRYRVALPIWLERDLTGLIEQWALETDWVELVSNTSLDEGDIVRMFRRTLDFLSQIPHVPHLSESLKQNAIRARHLIDRFPINEAVD
ncbi:DSH-like [Planktothrix serta PCC 8927]|uniref:DSH-like n=1 Tax=Planktothrix serta PCC 8927 TaxID=671068 RepID=A0A7Z9BHM6_9CYAN|nr:DEAD/DEAH box helicase [Planktothrix serta]VXD13913.1 DSH-like [Planktothrix serta PCC 8927]